MANLKIHKSHIYKVVLCLVNTASRDVVNELYYNWGIPTLSLEPHKAHQIVIGSNSWHSGKSIHFLDDANKMFCPSIPVQAVQDCIITFKKGAIRLRIDNRTLHQTEVAEFVKSEGYADINAFKEAFFKQYTDTHAFTIVRHATLIHWTKLIY